jgi:hypothetical protein
VAGTVAALLGLALAVSGCSTAPDTTPVEASGTGADARAYVLGALQERASAEEAVWVEQSLDDLVPSHEFSIDGHKARALADAIVVGKVTTVEQGRGYMIEGDDAAGGVEIPFADPRSLWRVIVLTVKTDTRLGNVTSKTIKVGVVIDGSMDVVQARDGYLSLGRVAIVLNEPGKFEFDPSLYSIRQSGALIGLVSKTGDVSFPALGAENDEFVGDLDSVEAIVDEAEAPAEVVTVDETKGEFASNDK